MIVSYYGREPDIDRLRDLCAEVSPLAATILPCILTTDAGPYLHYIFGIR